MKRVARAVELLLLPERWIALVSLLLLALLPVVEIIIRELFHSGISGYNGYLANLVVIVAFLGGTLTARDDRHLSIRMNLDRATPWIRGAVATTRSLLSTTMLTAFFWASLSLVVIGFEAGQSVGVVPVRYLAAVMPVGFALMAIRYFRRAPGRLLLVVAAAGFVLGTWLSFGAFSQIVFVTVEEVPLWIDPAYTFWFDFMRAAAVPLIVVLIASAFIGVPLFVALGGSALLLFARVGGSVEVVANEGYVLLTGNTIPAIPLFTLAGFFLSESRAGERLVRLFRALFGWLPGGLVIASILASTFFTTFTGASGVTILALGGLLLYVLVGSGRHSEGFATGILTASGSLGLFFPPSLAIIVYGSIAQVSIFDLFLGGILPGALMVAAMCGVGVAVSLRRNVATERFDYREALRALRESALELLLPVVVIVVYFTGLTTLVETAAVAAVYALVLEVVVRREILYRDLGKVLVKALVVIGGVLMILALARALSYYIIDVQVADRLSDWVTDSIASRFLFLLLLNVVLLLAGCFMDIFSAILVVAPLVIPLGALFSIDPVHLGVVFVANMGIGFITPPVGMNLFLASYRFDVSLPKIYRAVLPFFLVQLAIVLVITYVPWLSTVFLATV